MSDVYSVTQLGRLVLVIINYMYTRYIRYVIACIPPFITGLTMEPHGKQVKMMLQQQLLLKNKYVQVCCLIAAVRLELFNTTNS